MGRGIHLLLHPVSGVIISSIVHEEGRALIKRTAEFQARPSDLGVSIVPNAIFRSFYLVR